MKKNSNLEFHIGKETINIVHEYTYLFLKLLQYSSHANKADVVVFVGYVREYRRGSIYSARSPPIMKIVMRARKRGKRAQGRRRKRGSTSL